jgi:signal transduction histidine kinase
MDLVLSAMPEGVALFDDDGALTFHNPALEQHLGAVPTSLDAVLPLPLRGIARAAARERVDGVDEAEVGAPTRWLGGTAVPVGQHGVLLIVRDVTESRRLDQIRRDFVANASHELKTPAATIQAAAETIRRAANDDPPVVPRFAAQLEREAVRLSRIISDLLDLTRLEAGSDREELVALDAIVRDEAERFDDRAADAGVSIRFDTEAVPRIRGSGRDLALLVRNLVDNAIQYTRPGGEVEIDVRPDGDDVILVVTDTGLGIPKRDLPRVFERFYRVDRARSRETGGTGLGLSIVRHVVENHGGVIAVESELGRGTRFEVRLKRDEQAAPQTGEPAPSAPSPIDARVLDGTEPSAAVSHGRDPSATP